MKTSELIGPTLDWAVAKAKGDFQFEVYFNRVWYLWFATHGSLSPHHTDSIEWLPSTSWEQGGPIIERECIAIDKDGEVWCASMNDNPIAFYGPTPLIAAMRAFVASRLGDEVEIPPELLS